MEFRPDLVDEKSPKHIEILQLTDDEAPSSHIYMEAHIFTPDSKRFLLHSPAEAHGEAHDDPRHRYLLCDIEDNCRLIPLIHERGATSPSIGPDGACVYYLVDQTFPGGGRLTLKRVGIDGSDRRTILLLDSPLPGTSLRPSRIYPLSTISSDGKRLAVSAFLGDGKTEHAPWGLLVFDLENASVELVLHGPTWCNMHAQYCPSPDAEAGRDILVQENHDSVCSPTGDIVQLVGGAGADVHVIRDDGTNLRTMPWGRDGVEFCQGHQCWRGRSGRAITSTHEAGPPPVQRLIEAAPVPEAGHLGRRSPGSVRNDLTRQFPQPGFCHFGTDIEGRRLVSDCAPFELGGRVFLAELPAGKDDPIGNFTYLLNPRCSGRKESHIHPFLSPDGSAAFFNSDESGVHRAYMVRGW